MQTAPPSSPIQKQQSNEIVNQTKILLVKYLTLKFNKEDERYMIYSGVNKIFNRLVKPIKNTKGTSRKKSSVITNIFGHYLVKVHFHL